MLTAAIALAQLGASPCSTLPVLVRGGLIVTCDAGLCAADGRALLKSSTPIRAILPGPAAGVIAVHRGSRLELWLGDDLAPLLDLGTTDIQVRPVLTERLALARPTATNTTVVSVLGADRAEVPIFATKGRLVDFACSAGDSCVALVGSSPGAPMQIFRFEDGTAVVWGAVANAQRILWSSSRLLLQVWDGTKVVESQLPGVWNTATVEMHRGCPVVNSETGLIEYRK
jgi:hypothetical protein